jgi:transcriptional regulator with XRE-family HTH domain
MPRRVTSPEARELILAIGKALRAVRRLKKVKALSLSMDAGVAKQSISCWENGKAAIELPTLFDACKALDVPMWQVIRSAENALAMRKVMEREKASREARLQALDEQE